MTRATLNVLIVALPAVVSAAVAFRIGYAEGSLATAGRWSNVTDRCIAKLESTLIIARAGGKAR